MAFHHFRRIVLVAILTVAALPAAAQTMFQTLPQGFTSVDGSSASSFPQNTMNDQIWQWRYDSSEFETQAPIVISSLAIRPSTVSNVAAFDFDKWQVTLIEATTDVGSPDSTFAANILRSEVVRVGPWSGGPLLALPFGSTGGFVSMGSIKPFVYDPSSGNDFIIQIEKCGTTSTWGTTIDGTNSSPGGRIGHTTDCTASAQSSSSGFVPIVRIGYRAASQTLPSGFETVDGNGSVGWPVTTATQQKWQWHYSDGEFDTCGPIAINEIWIRVSNPANALGAFSFGRFDVTLASARTYYLSHNPRFAANIKNQKLVRSGPWSGGPVAASGEATATWIPLGLTESFIYDPQTSEGLIVQIEKCGTTTPWNQTMDGRLGMVVGGDRFGHTTSCTSLTQNHTGVNNLVPIIRIDYEPVTKAADAVTCFPWREDFDDGFEFIALPLDLPPGWNNIEGETSQFGADWNVRFGSTSTPNTGPSSDHTTGSARYLLLDDNLTSGERITINTPPLDFAGVTNPHLSFWCHSRRALFTSESFLSVDVMVLPDGPLTEDVVVPIGNLGPTWTEVTIDLSAFAGEAVMIRFRGDTSAGGSGHDIAIDDVRVYEPTAQAGQAPQVSSTLCVKRALEPNGIPVSLGVPGPYTVKFFDGDLLDMTIKGQPNQPVLLMSGLLNVGNFSLPGIGQVDIGGPGTSGIVFVIDGLTGTGLVPGLASTDGAGEYDFDMFLGLPPGLNIPLQAAVYTGGPSVLAVSNAVVIATQ